MNIEGDYLVVEIDNDESIDGRYKRQDFKQWRKSSLKSVALWVKDEPVSICFHIAKYHNEETIHVSIRAEKFGAATCFKNSYWVGSWVVSNNAYAFVKQQGKRSSFIISHFIHENGYYLAKIKMTPIEPIELELLPECCVCCEDNTQTSVTGYFQCNHKIICNDCYDKLRTKCCPYCRANK